MQTYEHGLKKQKHQLNEENESRMYLIIFLFQFDSYFKSNFKFRFFKIN